MFRLIRETIGRRRLLLGGAAASVGMLAGTAGRAAAQQGPPPVRGATGGSRVAGLQGDVSGPPYDYWPITRRPRLEWPNGARVAFWVGMNIEHFDIDRPATSISTATIMYTPDPLNYGWRDYAPRVGIWRFMDVMDKYGLRASVLLISDVCLKYPEI